MAETILEPGVSMECCQCRKSVLADPDFTAKGLHPSSVAKHLDSIGSPLGWEIRIEAGKGFIHCPVCLGGDYDPVCRCPMCLHEEVSTTFCPGPNCRRGLSIRHLHRTCQRCKYDWIQKTAADKKAE